MTDLAVKWVQRHALNVRISHWINLIAVGYLLVSGVHIFLDFPELYWGKTGFRGYPAAFRLEDLGISWDQAAAWGNRKWGRNYHFTFGWVFMINGLVYVAWSLYRRHFQRSMLHGRTSPGTVESRFAESSLAPSQSNLPSQQYGTPQYGPPQYATPQRFAYLGMIFVVTPLLFLTGIAQMPAFTAIAPWLIDMFGGRQTARTIHTIATVVVVVFVLVHVGQVIAAGPIRKVRGMITGRAAIMEQ